MYGFLIVVDCKISDWSNCTKTCGKGERNRSIIVKAEHYGQPCEGPLSETCNPDPCPGKQFFFTKLAFKAIIILETKFLFLTLRPLK